MEKINGEIHIPVTNDEASLISKIESMGVHADIIKDGYVTAYFYNHGELLKILDKFNLK